MFSTEMAHKSIHKKNHVPLFDCAGINKGAEGVIVLYEPSRMLLQRKKKKEINKDSL